MNANADVRHSKAAHVSIAWTIGLVMGAAPLQWTMAAERARAPAGAAADQDQVLEEVVVTGTLVRGVAPTGANVVSLDQSTMEETGAQNVAQLVATIPQLSQFGQVAQAPLQNTALGIGRTSYRPSVRQLPLGVVSPLLVMVDGHALVGAGFQQTDGDPGLIPPGAIERLELVLDGGSSMYGANAVGGVMNFITRSRLDGIEVTGNAGAGSGNSYRSGDVNVTAGRSWQRGNGLVSLYYRESTNLANTDRPLPRQDLRAYGLPDYRARNCSPGTVIVGTTTYALPALVPGTVNLCDTSAGQDTASAERQWGVFASLTQELSSDVDVNFKAMVSNRHTRPRGVAYTELPAGVLINNTNPFFRPVGTETSHRVAFDYSALTGNSVGFDLELEGIDLTSTLTWRMPRGWRTVGTLSYGRTHVFTNTPQVNTAASAAALAGAGLTTATALNPYNVGATNPAVIARILDWHAEASNIQTQSIARVIADGDLFNIPGGVVKSAIGVQYMVQGTDAYRVVGVNNSMAGARFGKYDRWTAAAFGQLNFPIVSPEMGLPLARSLDLDLSARYDNYETVGGTTNPRIGATWGVTEGFKIRGSWSTAYTAPTVVDETPTGSVDASIAIVPTGPSPAFLLAGDSTTNLTRPSLSVGGALPNTQKPQEAETWSLGFDLRPTKLPGLEVSGTFWRVEMTDALVNGCPGTVEQEVANPRFGCSLKNPTLAQLQALLPPGLPVSGLGNSVEGLYANGTPPYLLISSLRQNSGAFQTEGIDFRVGYRHEVAWGAIYASAAGTQYLLRRNQQEPGAVFTDTLINSSPYNAIYTVGTDVGPKFTASVRANYQASFDVNNLAGRTSMPSFVTTDLFLRYELSDSTQLTLNANNVLDEMPIVVNVSGGQYTNAAINQQSTIGRYFALGLKKKF